MPFLRVLISALALLCAASAAQAKPQACLTSLEGFPTALKYDTSDAELKQNRSFRERMFGGYGGITCPGYVTLRAMTPGLSDSERSVFCLHYDAKAKTYTGFAEGPRDAYVNCAAPGSAFCERVNASAETAMAIASYGATAAGQAALNTVTHGSGAVILSGSGSAVAGNLGTFGTSVASVLSAPGTLAAAAVTVVAVGGLVYVCAE
jgi:hypothetical protein